MRCFMHEWLTVVREKCKVRFKPGGGITSFRKSKAISKRQVILQNMLPLDHKNVLQWFSFFEKAFSNCALHIATLMHFMIQVES